MKRFIFASDIKAEIKTFYKEFSTFIIKIINIS